VTTERNIETLAQIAAACSQAGYSIASVKLRNDWPNPESEMRRETAEQSVLLALAICAKLDKLLQKAAEGGAL
jgi:hypothetical protein